ncbi:caspase family protein [Kribbella sp. NBC_00382]|uniref:caspase family protein n=1 Tax=Kribbella sp. NBC_00382 TaxID=2975967 RepID=UPI002E1FBDF6
MGGARIALVIANAEYNDPGLSRLMAPARDAAALAGVLGDPEVGGFDVRVLQNESAQTIRYAVEDFFSDRSPEDLLLLHFSCHGVKNAAGELFLAVADTKPTRLASTAVAADFVNRQMADSRAQRIALFLDCCYGGAFPRGLVVRATGEAQVRDAFAGQDRVGGGRGRVVVTASSAMEYAFEDGQLAAGTPKPSVFTSAVVDGLKSGDADKDGDGWVGLTELVGYVTDQVHRITPNQNPQMWTFGSQGELLIARSNRITPRLLAPELLEAMASPLSAARFGVVDYLRERLTSEDQGLALAAYQALTQLTNDDSRKVSEAATRALTDTPPALQDLVRGSAQPNKPVPPAAAPAAAPPAPPPSYAAQQHAKAQRNQQALRDLANAHPLPKPASTTTPPAAAATPAPAAAAPASSVVPWWVVVVLVVGAVVLVIVNWPGAVDSRRIWSDDSNTGWRVYRSWFDPEILASVVVLAAGLAARWMPVAMGIALGAVLSIGEDAFLFLAGGLAAEETAEWLVAGFVALILAVAIVVVLKPQPRPWPVRAPAFALIVAGGIVLLLGTLVQHNDGISFSTVTKLALLEPFVIVALGWLAIAAIEARTRSWLTATAVTYAVISMVAAVPALTEGKSASDLLAGLFGNLLVIAGVAYATRRPFILE